MHLFNYCIITASNDRQAQSFRSLLQRRIDHGLYPREVQFRVYSDPPSGRIGSGGGTVWALKQLFDEEQITDVSGFLSANRVLMLHAGGESRRMPCYAPEGKLFAPVPATSSSVFPPVVLDLQLSLFLDYPWHDGELIVASGDAIIDFDTTTIPDERGDVCGFAAAASVEQGSHHGVFVMRTGEREVCDYYQKRSPEFLIQHATFEGTVECALDIGIISMSPRFVASLVEWSKVPISDEISSPQTLFESGNASFDLYRELMLATLAGVEEERYLEDAAQHNTAPHEFLRALFRSLHQYPLNAVLARRTTFLHVGALGDFAKSCDTIVRNDLRPFYERHEYGEIMAEAGAVTTYNCIDTTVLPVTGTGKSKTIGVVEGCSSSTVTMGGAVITGLGNKNLVLPYGICFEERRTLEGDVLCVYGTDDSFKPSLFDDAILCGQPLRTWLEHRLLTPDAVGCTGDTFDVIDSELFSSEFDLDFIEGFWKTPEKPDIWRNTFIAAKKYSLRTLNDRADPVARDEMRIAERASIMRKNILSGVGFLALSSEDAKRIFLADDASVVAKQIANTRDPLLRMYRSRIFVDTFAENEDYIPDADDLRRISFSAEASSSRKPLKIAVKPDQIVWARSPLRLDLAGGWTDTPPYTNRFGGTVVNVAVDLNGQPPIQVFVRPTSEKHIRFHSIDLGVTETYTETSGLLSFFDLSSAFSLAKASLSLIGLIADHDHRQLKQVLDEIGCGIEVSILCAVPKGSGLGTSSILGATIIAALHRFFGNSRSDSELFLDVLELEQMLTTGGGWQDQIGGVVGGIKYVTSMPGLKPVPVVHRLDDYLFVHESCANRLTLFYTGITRLAKNILQEVVDNANRATPSYLFTHIHLSELAKRARTAIERRSFDMLSRVFSDSWAANKLIHPSSTNEEIEALMERVRPYIAGGKLLGAGGGGYALFASPSVSDAQSLRQELMVEFAGSSARIVDLSLNTQGLTVTTS